MEKISVLGRGSILDVRVHGGTATMGEEIECWDGLPKLAYNCLDDHFYVYSLSRL